MKRLTWAALCIGQLCVAGPCLATTSAGTGFFITPTGYIATNLHVVRGAVSISARDSRGQVYPGQLVRVDTANDLALIKVEGSFPFLLLARSSAARKGDAVFTLGYPNVQLQGLAVKLTDGTVSSLSGLQDEPNTFQISVPVQPGNSGGPLINREGAVVGVVVAKLSAEAALRGGSQLPEVVNYAIKSNYLLELIGTEANAAKRVRLSEHRGKESALPSLVAKAEPAIVFVLATDELPLAATAIRPAPEPPTKPAPVEQQPPSAQALFLEAQKANSQGRRSDGISLLRKSAGLGSAEAQAALGYNYESGSGVTQNDDEAVAWYRRAADQGIPAAQNNLGRMFAVGKGVARDDAAAVDWYRRAAEQGYAISQRNLASMYYQGRGVTKDDAEVIKWSRRAAEQGDAESQYNLGFMYELGRGVPQDGAEAIRWFRMAAEQGQAKAQGALGLALMTGRGVAKDSAEGVQWLGKSAAKGNQIAQSNLGLAYVTGDGVPRDATAAARRFREAAAQGDASAEASLGVLYERGSGVAQDDAEAVWWYRKSAEQGNATAQSGLGSMYFSGRGVARDDAEAASWYRKAAEQGLAVAQNNLGRMYELGRGVERDKDKAALWYRKAAEQSFALAREGLKRLGVSE